MPFGTKVHSFSHSLQKTEWELIENSGISEHLKIVTRAECWNSKNAWRWECQHSRKRGGERVKNLKIQKIGCSKYWQTYFGVGRSVCGLAGTSAPCQTGQNASTRGVCLSSANSSVWYCILLGCVLQDAVWGLLSGGHYLSSSNQEGCPFVYHRNKRNICCMCVMSGEGEIAGLTDTTVPRRLGPKRASKIRRLFNLAKEDDVRQYVVRRPLPEKDGKCVCAYCLSFPKLSPLFYVTLIWSSLAQKAA